MASTIRPYPDPLPKKSMYPPFGGNRISPKILEPVIQAVACLCLGAAGLYLCASGRVGWMLAPKFFPWLAWGCVALLVLSAYAIARSVRSFLGAAQPADQLSDNCCTREPGATKECLLALFTPVRFALMSFPLGLLLMGMPSQGLASATALDIHLFETRQIERTGSVNVPSFSALMVAAQTPEGRAHFEGREVTLTGKILGVQSDRFTLIRYRMNCCAADAYPMKAAVVVAEAGPAGIFSGEWDLKMVQVRGQLQFTQDKDSSWLPVLVIPPITPDNPLAEWVQELPNDPSNLYEYSS